MEFFLPMIPPTVTHQDKDLRAWVGKDGRVRTVLHDSERLKDAKAKFRAHLAKYRPEKPIAPRVPVRLLVKWLFPAGDKHRDGEWMTDKPDTENLNKALVDCMTALDFWADDAQVVSEIIEKFWANTPGIYIRVEVLKEDRG